MLANNLTGGVTGSLRPGQGQHLLRHICDAVMTLLKKKPEISTMF